MLDLRGGTMGTSTTQFPAKRNHSRHALAGISIAKQATKPTETPQGSAFTRAVNAILIAPARWALCVSIFGGAMFALFGYVQRICFPQCVVVVQQFEVSPEVAKRLSM